MGAFDIIIRKLNQKIESLANNGENNNGKIDTTKEKNELANLLAGAREEVGDLFNKKIENLKQQSNSISKSNYDKKYETLETNRDNALAKIVEMGKSLMKSLNGYEQATGKNKWNNTLTEDVQQYSPDEETIFVNGNEITHIRFPESVSVKNNVFKINPDNSYEEKLNETENSFNVFVRDKDGNEIGKKSYTKSKKAIYTNKEQVARNCGLTMKKDIENIKTGTVSRVLQSIIFFPLASRLFEVEDNEINVLNKLGDNEALDFNSGLLYEWNPETHEYKKVGSIEQWKSQHTHGVTEWGNKIYDKPADAE